VFEFISLFAGIAGFELGFSLAGMECIASVEIDKAAQNITRKWFPETEVYGDIREYEPRRTVDLVCGGFPCQDLSIAGKRAGLGGKRSGLWFEFYRVITSIKPRWVVIENVPGLLSSCGCSTCGAMRRILRVHKYLRHKRQIYQLCPICYAAERLLASHRGRDFAIILRGLAECGYGVAWRILDAQYFGVAQRRRRVFIVASLGSGRAAQVLFERESLPGNTPPSRKAGQGIAHAITHGPSSGYRYDPNGEDYITGTLDRKSTSANRGSQANELEFIIVEQNNMVSTPDMISLRADPAQPVIAVQHAMIGREENSGPQAKGWRDDGATWTLDGRGEADAVCWEMAHANEAVREGDDIAPTLQKRMGTGGNQVPLIGVRRLTPTECERLQGFPDGWTTGQSDSVRYKQLGNAVAVPVITWIGKRIMEVDSGEGEKR
jgi:DNA (cytosine-5)-methyltransferase 1